MRVCKALPCDMLEIERIYRCARAFMKDNGNPKQWGDEYPEKDLIENDIRLNRLYLLKQGDKPCAAFVFYIGDDAAYRNINGRWKNALEYGVIHRLASDGSQRGVFNEVLKFCETKAKTIKIDTHRDNFVMQSLIKSAGFEYCGTVYLENGDERLAFQK